MRPLTEQIFRVMCEVQIRPHLFGSPEVASGIVTALGWVGLAEELQQPIEVAAGTANRLIAEATADVAASSQLLVGLCDECVEPQHRASYEALSRHAALFIHSLLEHIRGHGGDGACRPVAKDSP
jgi:hypothetical protein